MNGGGRGAKNERNERVFKLETLFTLLIVYGYHIYIYWWMNYRMKWINHFIYFDHFKHFNSISLIFVFVIQFHWMMRNGREKRQNTLWTQIQLDQQRMDRLQSINYQIDTMWRMFISILCNYKNENELYFDRQSNGLLLFFEWSNTLSMEWGVII